MFQMDFSESAYGTDVSMSLEDEKALSIIVQSLSVVDGHYQVDLPFRDQPNLPNNRNIAERRLNSLKSRLKKDPDLYEKYKRGIDDNVKKGYAEKVSKDQSKDIHDNGNVWYLPHHPVVHP